MNEREFRRRFPNASSSTVAVNASIDAEIPDPEPERNIKPALERQDEGETPLLGRTSIRITGYRVRPLDPDNFAGGCKQIIDGLRFGGLISGDEPWTISLVTEQIKVRHFSKEKTLIEIIWP